MFSNELKSASKETVEGIIQLLKEDNYKKDAIVYFKAWFCVSDVIELCNMLKSSYSKMELIKQFSQYDHLGISAYNLIDTVDAGDSHYRFEVLNFLNSKLSENNKRICLDKFATDNDKIKLLNLYNIVNLYNTAENLADLLNHFSNDNMKLKALEKKLLDGIILKQEMINVITCFKKVKYQEKACKLLFNADKQKIFNNDCCLSVLTMFTKNLRPCVLNEYRKHHTILSENLVPFVKQLDSKTKAVEFLTRCKVENIDAILQVAGLQDQKNDYISESESEEATQDEDDDDFDDLIPIKNQFLGCDVYYDRKKDVVLYNGSPMSGGITINGVDLIKEARSKGRKHFKKLEKKKLEQKKKNSLKVPHAWTDEKADDKTDDKDVCVICMANKRMITLDCGHFHTCGHCTRVILKEKKGCPMCRKEITSVLRTFA